MLVQAIDAAMEAAALTDGLVDPTLGHSLEAVGNDRDIALISAASLLSIPPGQGSTRPSW